MTVSGDGAMAVDALGGRMHVRWDEGAAATPRQDGFVI